MKTRRRQLYRGSRCGFKERDRLFGAKRTCISSVLYRNGETRKRVIQNFSVSAELIMVFPQSADLIMRRWTFAQGTESGAEHIRYCGTLLKYSVSEADLEKSLHLVTIGRKRWSQSKFPLHPLRDVQKVRGCLSGILSSADPKSGMIM